MKINAKGLMFQNWLHLMVFSVLILVVLWVLQIWFLKSFYQGMKLHEIKTLGDKITEEFGETDFLTLMDEYAFNNNLRIIVLDESGKMALHSDGFYTEEPLVALPGDKGLFPQSVFDAVQQRFMEEESDRVCYFNRNENNDISQAIYAARVSDAQGGVYYLFVNCSIPPIDSAISVLKTQFIIVTVILFVLALIVAQWISRRMSKPIIRLTKSAQRLMKGEVDADFYDEGFTEIHQLANALNYAAKELRCLDNYRKEFIANVSHDLKTPLTIIKFYGEMIRDVSGDNPEKRDEHCATIIKEADWLTDMVGEILELSKLESGNAEVSMTRVNLSRSLMGTLESFRMLLDKEGYSFAADIEGGVMVDGNEPMLRRVIYNLISNAVNYTGPDKRLTISLKNVEGYARFEVTDTGEGISEEKQSVIWDRYYKSDKPHKRPVVGSGLGLSIVKNILDLHKASYGVISEEGCGSTFWFAWNDEAAKV